MGVKGPSILSSLPNFDIAQGLVYDSLHGHDLGVSRQLGSLWFDSSNSKQDWYIGQPSTITSIDNRAVCIKPPGNVTRMYRSLNQRAYWKGSEWKHFVISYGPTVLKNILKPAYYRHFLLYSEACFILNQTTITQDDLFRAGENLDSFVEQFQSLYGLRNMSSNIHLLLHCVECVRRWGPLWAYSAYGFEHLNGNLLQMFNGTQAVEQQIVKKFNRLQTLKAITAKNLDIAFTSNSCVLPILKRLLGEFVPTKKHFRTDDTCVLIGISKEFLFPIELLAESTPQIKNIFPHPFLVNLTTRSYSKLVSLRNVFTINDYKVSSRRQNCFVKLKNGFIFQIINFTSLTIPFSFNNREQAIVLGKKLTYRVFDPLCKSHIVIVEEFVPVSAFLHTEILSKCVQLCDVPKYVLSILPNLMDRD